MAEVIDPTPDTTPVKLVIQFGAEIDSDGNVEVNWVLDNAGVPQGDVVAKELGTNQ